MLALLVLIGAASIITRPRVSDLPPFLNTDRPLLVSLGAPLFIEIPQLGYYRNKAVNSKEDVTKSRIIETIRKALKAEAVQPRFIYGSSGERKRRVYAWQPACSAKTKYLAHQRRGTIVASDVSK